MKKLLYGFLLSIVIGIGYTYAQADILSALEEEEANTPKQNFAQIFDGTRIINSQTVEMTEVGSLQFIVFHRFGSLLSMQNAVYQFLGFNVAAPYVSLDFTPVKWLNIGVGYALKEFAVDGQLKFQVLRQQTGIKNIPLSLNILTNAYINTGPYATSVGTPQGGKNFTDRMTYLFQIMAARQFCDRFSLQIMPTMVHYNASTLEAPLVNDVFSIGVGARVKFSSKYSLIAEYYRQLNGYLAKTHGGTIDFVPDFLSLGVEIKTGNHTFQLFLSNAAQVTSPRIFNVNTTPFYKGDVRIGFNLNRSFGIVKKKIKPIQ